MSAPRYHWLVAGNVISASKNGQARQRGLNVLIKTDEPHFTRENLAQAQQGLMRRFLTEGPQEKGAEIVDVFTLSVSSLGLQTEEQFEGRFNKEGPEVEEYQLNA